MTNFKVIAETDNFTIEYSEEKGMYRVSYFENNHFVDDCMFDEVHITQCRSIGAKE